MDISYSTFRQHLKEYMDYLCSSDDVIKVTRQRGENTYVISQNKLATMSVKEFRKLQTEARLTSYLVKFDEVKKKS